MDINSLQYLMGHSDAAVTMNVYNPYHLRPCRSYDAEDITAAFAERGAQVELTLGHFSYTRFTPFGREAA